jgi:hypothetical protein
MPDEISGMGKTHRNASLLCKKNLSAFKQHSRFILFIYIYRLDPLKVFKNDDIDGSVAPEREYFSPERVLKEMYPAQYCGSQNNISNSPSPSPRDNLDYRFSISQLPSWAKKKVKIYQIASKFCCNIYRLYFGSMSSL